MSACEPWNAFKGCMSGFPFWEWSRCALLVAALALPNMTQEILSSGCNDQPEASKASHNSSLWATNLVLAKSGSSGSECSIKENREVHYNNLILEEASKYEAWQECQWTFNDNDNHHHIFFPSSSGLWKNRRSQFCTHLCLKVPDIFKCKERVNMTPKDTFIKDAIAIIKKERDTLCSDK